MILKYFYNFNFLSSYVKKKGGIQTESSYAYTGRDGSCKFKSNQVVAKVKSYTKVSPRNEDALKKAVAKIGPISVCIDASSKWQYYSSGVFKGSCSSSCNAINHAVLAVGYANGAWIVKNSWGTSWGENGYIRMKMGGNICGIGCYGAYSVS